jgi:hypothetical protein
MGIYLELKENAKPGVFMSEPAPTKETHPQYDIIYGPFKTTEEAQAYIEAMQDLTCGDGAI